MTALRDLTSRAAATLLAVLLFFSPSIALAEALSSGTSSDQITSVDIGPLALSPDDFLTELATAARSLGGLSTLAKAVVIITLLVSSLKVTVLRKYVWSRLGSAQVLVAPLLALTAGLLGLGSGGAPLTPAVVVAYLTAGGGAILLHELLDAAKRVPAVQAAYLKARDALGFDPPAPPESKP